MNRATASDPSGLRSAASCSKDHFSHAGHARTAPLTNSRAGPPTEASRADLVPAHLFDELEFRPDARRRGQRSRKSDGAHP